MYEYKAQIQRVIDGDTAVAVVDLGFSTFKNEHLRLFGINTPELNSKDEEQRAAAKAAQNALSALIVGKVVIVKTFKDRTEKYGRMLAEIFITDDKGVVANVNQWMIDNKYATIYPKHFHMTGRPEPT
jgi:micrococcal nuclease